MNKEELQAMLNLTYEMQGLIELALNREPEATAEMYGLIAEKSYAMSALAQKWGAPRPEGAVRSTEYNAEGAEPEKTVEERFNEALEASRRQMEESVEEPKEEELVKELTEDGDTMYLPSEEKSDIVDTIDGFEESAEEPAAVKEEQAPQEEDISVWRNFDDEGESAFGVYAAIDSDPRLEAASAKPARRPGSFFSVNDNFRFRRELFGNSAADFTASLGVVEGLADYKAAEDYFYNDLQWDASKPEVEEFMGHIADYFKQK